MDAFNSIFTTVSDSAWAEQHLQRAGAFAAAYDAHLEVLSLGVDRTQFGYYAVGGSAVVLQETLTRASDQAQICETIARSVLNDIGARFTVETEMVPFVDVGRRAGIRARFSDLVIMPQPYAKDMPAEQEAITEAALFEAGAPVLVLPEQMEDVSQPKRISVAWNESAESMRAVRAALPLLKAAESCKVVLVDPAGAQRQPV